MLKSIVIDIGNTNVKIGVFDGNALVATHVTVTKQVIATLKKIIRQHTPTHSILSNVGKPLAELQTILKQNTTLILLRGTTHVPINVKYKSKTLGTDRLSLAVLANNLFPNQNALVISAGTCITYDFVDSDGNYLGGSISPGLNMRLQAMHDYTVKLPKVKLDNDAMLIGNTTESSLLSGAVIGAANEINGYIEQYRKEYKGLKLVLTGGDASYLEPRLKFKIFARPYAALEGLQRILQYNIGAL